MTSSSASTPARREPSTVMVIVLMVGTVGWLWTSMLYGVLELSAPFWIVPPMLGLGIALLYQAFQMSKERAIPDRHRHYLRNLP